VGKKTSRFEGRFVTKAETIKCNAETLGPTNAWRQRKDSTTKRGGDRDFLKKDWEKSIRYGEEWGFPGKERTST